MQALIPFRSQDGFTTRVKTTKVGATPILTRFTQTAKKIVLLQRVLSHWGDHSKSSLIMLSTHIYLTILPTNIYPASTLLLKCDARLQPLLLETLPAPLLCDQLSSTLTDTQHSQHGVDGGHLGETSRVRNPDALEPANLQLGVHNGHLVLCYVTHLGCASGVVYGVCDAATVLGELFVGDDLRARRDFALDPVREGGLLGDLAGSLETGDNGGCVVALGVGEVAEVERGLDGGVGGGEVDAAAGAGTGDVGRHAECVDGGVVTHAGDHVSCSAEMWGCWAYRAVFRQNGIW